MAEKSDIPRASASLRSITPMVRITGGPGADSAPVRAWTNIMLVPPGKEEHRAASYGSRCDHAVPQPEPILTQESTMGSRNTWTATPIPGSNVTGVYKKLYVAQSLKVMARRGRMTPAAGAASRRLDIVTQCRGLFLHFLQAMLDDVADRDDSDHPTIRTEHEKCANSMLGKRFNRDFEGSRGLD